MNAKLLEALQDYVSQVSSFAIAVSSVAGTNETMELLQASQSLSVELQEAITDERLREN